MPKGIPKSASGYALGVWHNWSGGNNPIPGMKCMIMRRDGQFRRHFSGNYSWGHCTVAPESDIVMFMPLYYENPNVGQPTRNELGRLD